MQGQKTGIGKLAAMMARHAARRKQVSGCIGGVGHSVSLTTWRCSSCKVIVPVQPAARDLPN